MSLGKFRTIRPISFDGDIVSIGDLFTTVDLTASWATVVGPSSIVEPGCVAATVLGPRNIVRAGADFSINIGDENENRAGAHSSIVMGVGGIVGVGAVASIAIGGNQGSSRVDVEAITAYALGNAILIDVGSDSSVAIGTDLHIAPTSPNCVLIGVHPAPGPTIDHDSADNVLIGARNHIGDTSPSNTAAGHDIDIYGSVNVVLGYGLMGNVGTPRSHSIGILATSVTGDFSVCIGDASTIIGGFGGVVVGANASYTASGLPNTGIGIALGLNAAALDNQCVIGNNVGAGNPATIRELIIKGKGGGITPLNTLYATDTPALAGDTGLAVVYFDGAAYTNKTVKASAAPPAGALLLYFDPPVPLPGTAGTLANAYNQGTAAADQTMIITDAHGGGIIVNATTPGLVAVTAFEIDVIGGSFNFYTKGGFDVSSSITIAVPAAISTWNANLFLASTLTLTAGGVAPNELALTRFQAPTITETAPGAAYVIPIAATVIIDAPPTADASGGQSPTLSNRYAFYVKNGDSVIASQPAGVYASAYVKSFSGGVTAVVRGGDTVVQFGSTSASRCEWLVGGATVVQLWPTTYNVTIGGISDAPASRLRVYTPVTVASAAGAIWNGVDFVAGTLTITGGPGTITTMAFFNVTGPTITSAAANVITDFYTQRIGAATFAGAGPASATRSFSLFSEGNTKFGGGMTFKGTDVNVAGPYVVLETDFFLEVRRTATSIISINLPSIATAGNGRVIAIIDSGYNAGVFNITVVRNGGDTINNAAANYVINTPGSCIWFKANATTNNWEIV